MTTTAPSDCPTITVELCLNGTGALTAATVWTDVTTYVRGFGVRGPSRDRDTGRFNGGSTMIVLANRDRRFDPSYAAGPYFGKLVPRVQGRIRATWSAVTYPCTYFYVDRWPQSLPQGMYDAEVPITGSDGFRLLNSNLPESVWQLQVENNVNDVINFANSSWYRLAEESGTAMADSSVSVLHGSYEGGATFNHRTSLLPFSDNGAIEFAGGDMVGATPPDAIPTVPYTVMFWVKIPDGVLTGLSTDIKTILRSDDGITNSPSTFVFYVDPITGNLVFYNAEMTPVYALNPRYSNNAVQVGHTYFVALTYTAGTPVLYINGVAQSATGSGYSGLTGAVKGCVSIGGRGSSTFNSWPGTIDEVVILTGDIGAAGVLDFYNAAINPWDGDTSGGRITNILDTIGWTASLRDLDTGLSVFGPTNLEGTALDYLQLIARSEDGLLYMATDGDLTFVDRTARRSDARFITSAGTFSDRTGTLLYEDIVTSGWDDESIVNVDRCSRLGGAVQEYRDTTSIAAYGEKAFDDTGLLLATDGEALDRATHRVLMQKDPAFRIESIKLRPRGNTALWPHALGRIIGDRVTIQLTPVAVGTAILTDCHIFGISHEITDVYTAADGKTGFDWVTTWQLEPVDPLLSFWAVVGSGAAKNQVGTAKASY